MIADLYALGLLFRYPGFHAARQERHPRPGRGTGHYRRGGAGAVRGALWMSRKVAAAYETGSSPERAAARSLFR